MANESESTEHRKYPEYVPDQWDMEMLAWAYLDEFSSLAMHEFTTGWSGNSHFCFERFEAVVKYLGEEKRREILKSFDECQTRRRGDDWQVFKQAFEPGFWSLPVIKDAVVRVAASVLSHPEDELHNYGEAYLQTLEEALRDFAPTLQKHDWPSDSV